LAIAWVTLAQKGIFLPGLIAQAISTGNAGLLQFKLFLTLFNSGDWVIGGGHTPASLRQVSLAFFYITGLFALMQLVSPAQPRSLRWIALTGLVLSLLIILASLSRSLILMVALGGFVVSLGLIHRRADALLYLLVIGALGLAALFLMREANGLFNIVEARFGGIGQDGRVTQYTQSLASIAERPFWGHGTGHKDEFRAGYQNMVHNLFLGAWVQAGLFGLATALTFTGLLVLTVLRTALRFYKTPQGLALVALLLLPLIRSQLGGQGGNYTLPEFLAVILALNLLYRRDLLTPTTAENVSHAKHISHPPSLLLYKNTPAGGDPTSVKGTPSSL
jgi:O-antigen ligase